MKAPETVRNYVNGVRVLHMLNNQPVEPFKSFEYAVTIRGIARIKQHHARQAAPLTIKILKRMADFVDPSDPSHLVIWAAVLLGFFWLLRKSSLRASLMPRSSCAGGISL